MGRDPAGFDYEQRGDEVVITHHGRRATVLRGAAAARFLDEVEDGDAQRRDAQQVDAQQLMARATGNYKRGNERTARAHPRNR